MCCSVYLVCKINSYGLRAMRFYFVERVIELYRLCLRLRTIIIMYYVLIFVTVLHYFTAICFVRTSNVILRREIKNTSL